LVVSLNQNEPCQINSLDVLAFLTNYRLVALYILLLLASFVFLIIIIHLLMDLELILILFFLVSCFFFFYHIFSLVLIIFIWLNSQVLSKMMMMLPFILDPFLAFVSIFLAIMLYDLILHYCFLFIFTESLRQSLSWRLWLRGKHRVIWRWRLRVPF
jgi:hypothetical protein